MLVRHELASASKSEQIPNIVLLIILKLHITRIDFQRKELCKIWKLSIEQIESRQKCHDGRIMSRVQNKLILHTLAIHQFSNMLQKSVVHWYGIKVILALKFSRVFHFVLVIYIASVRIYGGILFAHFNEFPKCLVLQRNIHAVAVEIAQSEARMLVKLIRIIDGHTALLCICTHDILVFLRQSPSVRKNVIVKYVRGGHILPFLILCIVSTHGSIPRRVRVELNIVDCCFDHWQ
mmetsp:Transcript_8767/g.14388  ORF Transcript_8767/g.14388 Transcript_8767/m.14388 type:complete len:235 (-) Transcript_8767:281-985(-)